MPSHVRRHDPEVQALAAQFRRLTLKARSLVGEIDATILMLDEYQKQQQEIAAEVLAEEECEQ